VARPHRQVRQAFQADPSLLGAPETQGFGKEAAESPVVVRADKEYVLRKKGKPDPAPAKAEKRVASRYYQLKSGCVLGADNE